MEKVLGKNSIDFFYKPVHRFVRQDDGDVSPGAQAQAVAEQRGGGGHLLGLPQASGWSPALIKEDVHSVPTRAG